MASLGSERAGSPIVACAVRTVQSRWEGEQDDPREARIATRPNAGGDFRLDEGRHAELVRTPSTPQSSGADHEASIIELRTSIFEGILRQKGEKR
jgi:hypothetical protein